MKLNLHVKAGCFRPLIFFGSAIYMIYFEQPYLTIEIDSEKKLMQLNWIGFATSEDYRTGLETALQLSRTHGVKKWLSNLKDMKAIRQAEQDWTVQSWFPLFNHTHLDKWAIVFADDMFNQMATSSMISKMRPTLLFPVEYFQDINTAKNWLDQNS